MYEVYMGNKTNKKELTLQDGTTVYALNPMVVSASRSTDIPAFYADWFFNRLDEGYSLWTNPFNGIKQYITYEDTRFIVFWSKNPRPLLNHLEKLNERNIGYYIQYSLNNYEQEGYEPNLPPYEERIDTFRKLVDKIGVGRVIWRNDPLMLTDKVSIDELLRRLEITGDNLKGYTKKLVFSFVDILNYRKVSNNLNKLGIKYINWTHDLMREFAKELEILNQKWHYTLATCSEFIDLSEYGIVKNKCIDDELIAKISYKDPILMNELGLEIYKINKIEKSLIPDYSMPKNSIPENSIIINNNNYAKRKKNKVKDSGQREYCGCIKSKDIGQYNTCNHFCVYCYANSSKEIALRNYQLHQQNPNASDIIGMNIQS